MKKGYIKIPINEVWELVNKPWRFYQSLYDEVKNLKCGNYDLLDFDKRCKSEILKRIKEKVKMKKEKSIQVEGEL